MRVMGKEILYQSSNYLVTCSPRCDSLGEPETRLKTALPGLFLATAGLLVFGFCAANPSPKGWVGLQVGYGMVSFGLMQVSLALVLQLTKLGDEYVQC